MSQPSFVDSVSGFAFDSRRRCSSVTAPLWVILIAISDQLPASATFGNALLRKMRPDAFPLLVAQTNHHAYDTSSWSVS